MHSKTLQTSRGWCAPLLLLAALSLVALSGIACADVPVVPVSVSAPLPGAAVPTHFDVVGTSTSGAYVRVIALIHFTSTKTSHTLFFANPADKSGQFHVRIDLPGRHLAGDAVDLTVVSVDKKGNQSPPLNFSVTLAH